MSTEYRYTCDELLAVLFGEQGFLVMASLDNLPAGHIIMPHTHGQSSTPKRVTGPSNWEEYRAQCLRACLLDTGKPLTGLIDRYPYYYRVEAAD